MPLTIILFYLALGAALAVERLPSGYIGLNPRQFVGNFACMFLAHVALAVTTALLHLVLA